MDGLAEERFRAKLERLGDHDVWTGAVDASGTGLVRIDGRLRTVQRAAWEFAHGPLAADRRVRACPADKRCVRVEHLRLLGSQGKGAAGGRRRRGRGSLREVHPGTWKLVVSDPPGQYGRTRRRYRSVHGTRRDAEQALRLLVESTESPIRLGDLRVRELLDRYLEWLDETEAASALPLAEKLIEPHLGRHHAVLLDADAVHDLLRRLHDEGVGMTQLAQVLALVAGSYRWARNQRWTDVDPTRDVGLRDIRT